jgi:hypothetical protein
VSDVTNAEVHGVDAIDVRAETLVAGLSIPVQSNACSTLPVR